MTSYTSKGKRISAGVKRISNGIEIYESAPIREVVPLGEIAGTSEVEVVINASKMNAECVYHYKNNDGQIKCTAGKYKYTYEQEDELREQHRLEKLKSESEKAEKEEREKRAAEALREQHRLEKLKSESEKAEKEEKEKRARLANMKKKINEPLTKDEIVAELTKIENLYLNNFISHDEAEQSKEILKERYQRTKYRGME